MRIEPRPDDVLIVVDVQYDFLPGGALAVPDGDAVIAPINALAGRFAHVVLTQDWHPPGHASFASSHEGKAPFETVELHYGTQVLWPDHCIQGTRGAEIAAELRIDHAKLIIRKGTHPAVDSYSGFLEADRSTPTGLAGYLKERSCRSQARAIYPRPASRSARDLAWSPSPNASGNTSTPGCLPALCDRPPLGGLG